MFNLSPIYSSLPFIPSLPFPPYMISLDLYDRFLLLLLLQAGGFHRYPTHKIPQSAIMHYIALQCGFKCTPRYLRIRAPVQIEFTNNYIIPHISLFFFLYKQIWNAGVSFSFFFFFFNKTTDLVTAIVKVRTVRNRPRAKICLRARGKLERALSGIVNCKL